MFYLSKVSTKVEGLITPGRQGYTIFVNASNLRHSTGDDDIYERLQSFLDTTGKVIDQSHYGSIKCHKSCYCSFTSKKNISHLTNDGIAAAVQSMSKKTNTDNKIDIWQIRLDKMFILSTTFLQKGQKVI